MTTQKYIEIFIASRAEISSERCEEDVADEIRKDYADYLKFQYLPGDVLATHVLVNIFDLQRLDK